MKKIIFLLLFFPLSIFAQVKISALTTTTAVATGDWLLKNNAAGTQTRKIKLGVMMSQYDTLLQVRGLHVKGVGGDGYIQLLNNTTGVSAPASGLRIYSNSGGILNVHNPAGYVYSFGHDALTANRQYNFPDVTGTFVILDATQSLSNKSVTGQMNVPTTVLTYTTSVTWNLNTSATAELTLTASTATVTPSNVKSGGTYNIEVIQDATGSRTMTWATTFKFPSGILPTLTTAASAKDIFQFVSFDGTNLLMVSGSFDVK